MGRAAAAAASRRAKKMRDLAGNLFETILRGELEHIEEYKSADLSPHLPLLSRLVFVQEQCQVFQNRLLLLHLMWHFTGSCQDGTYDSTLGVILQDYSGVDRCMEYVALDWPSVIEPIKDELPAVEGYARKYCAFDVFRPAF